MWWSHANRLWSNRNLSFLYYIDELNTASVLFILLLHFADGCVQCSSPSSSPFAKASRKSRTCHEKGSYVVSLKCAFYNSSRVTIGHQTSDIYCSSISHGQASLQVRLWLPLRRPRQGVLLVIRTLHERSTLKTYCVWFDKRPMKRWEDYWAFRIQFASSCMKLLSGTEVESRSYSGSCFSFLAAVTIWYNLKKMHNVAEFSSVQEESESHTLASPTCAKTLKLWAFTNGNFLLKWIILCRIFSFCLVAKIQVFQRHGQVCLAVGGVSRTRTQTQAEIFKTDNRVTSMWIFGTFGP